MKKSIVIIALAFMTAVGCSVRSRLPVEEPPPTPVPTVNIGGTELEVTAEELDLTTMDYDINKVISVGSELHDVKVIEMGDMDMSFEKYQELKKAYPDAVINFNLKLFGKKVDVNTKSLDLSDMTVEQTDELVAVLPYLEKLEDINFVNDEGVCVYNIDTITDLDIVHNTVPDVKLHVCFDLFGQTITSEDEEIEYVLAPIGNDGIWMVRSVLPYLTSCKRFLMDGCGVAYDTLAEMRDEFPETEIVWRVWFIDGDYYHDWAKRVGGILTDSERVRAPYVTDETSHYLRYFTKCKYLDVGHVVYLHDSSFLAYMPDLEVCIIAITSISDLSPIVNCKKLDYLEICQTLITDISPLAECPNLKHINMGYTTISDFRPLFDLDLERIWAIGMFVPFEQFDEYKELHPDVEIEIEGLAPYEGSWRYDVNTGVIRPRYKLLKEQMEYDIDTAMGIP